MSKPLPSFVAGVLFDLDGTPPPVATCAGTYRFGTDASAPDCTPIAGWA